MASTHCYWFLYKLQRWRLKLKKTWTLGVWLKEAHSHTSYTLFHQPTDNTHTQSLYQVKRIRKHSTIFSFHVQIQAQKKTDDEHIQHQIKYHEITTRWNSYKKYVIYMFFGKKLEKKENILKHQRNWNWNGNTDKIVEMYSH